ncbi:MAG TPA: thiamine pyrophosphate-binding protein [Bryobacteraceae bacterium]|nr:thiamine pyrophosphate-binding protein [Bryobacteraceae bacterium]
MSKSKRPDRRGFLKGAVAGAAALAAQAPNVTGQQVRAEATAAPAAGEVRVVDKPGSDFMVDVIKSLGIEYVFAMPGSSFAGFHESILNYAGNKNPEYITCMHEESSVAMANGYAKVEGKPVAICVHGTVGLQHAAMAVYDAFADRTPVYMILGNTQDATRRPSEVIWVHSAQDPAAMVRDYTKWDDQPVSLPHFAESAVRAYKIMMTPPMGPVAITIDTELQDDQIPAGTNLRIPKMSPSTPPAGDGAAVAEAAKMLVAAENPVLIAGRMARTPEGMRLLVELAELLQCAVIDQHRRLNFPSRHPLNQSNRAAPGGKPLMVPAALAPDLAVGLESGDFYSSLRLIRQRNPQLKVINISSGDLFQKSNYQNFQRYTEADLSIAADAEATLPYLIEACQKLITADRKAGFQARGAKLAEASKQALEKARLDASYGWDASPISTARLSAELWAQIKNEDWALVTDTSPWIHDWPLQLWDFNKHYQYIGGAGAEGVGYAAPAAVGAAFAHKRHGRLPIAIQPDGDLMCANGVLWTAAHHKIPLLTLMHNNRAYHQEVMGLQGLANRRQRGIDHIQIGTKIYDPFVDYAKLASSMGVRSEGPITDPKDLSAAIQRGIQVVKGGEPYLVDVVTQPR